MIESSKSNSETLKVVRVKDSSLYPSSITGLIRIAFYDKYNPN